VPRLQARPCRYDHDRHGNAVAAADPVWWATEHHLDSPRIEALRSAVESLIG